MLYFVGIQNSYQMLFLYMLDRIFVVLNNRNMHYGRKETYDSLAYKAQPQQY